MSLIIERSKPLFDINAIDVGDLVLAKHSSWKEAKTGIVTSALESQLRIQYVASIGNVTNYFRIRPDEFQDGFWYIRWSKDLSGFEEAGTMEGVGP